MTYDVLGLNFVGNFKLVYQMKEQTQPFCDVYVVRHGETDWNIVGRIQGHTDIPLNDLGLQQAHMLKEKLKGIEFSGAFSSNLSRAHTTAEILLEKRQLPISVSPALRERSFASWEGQLFKDFEAWCHKEKPVISFSSIQHYLSHKVHDNIESIAETYQRVCGYVLSQIQNYYGSKVLVVTHGGVMRAILDHHSEWSPKVKWCVENCAVVVLRVWQDQRIDLVDYQGVAKRDLSY